MARQKNKFRQNCVPDQTMSFVSLPTFITIQSLSYEETMIMEKWIST